MLTSSNRQNDMSRIDEAMQRVGLRPKAADQRHRGAAGDPHSSSNLEEYSIERAPRLDEASGFGTAGPHSLHTRAAHPVAATETVPANLPPGAASTPALLQAQPARSTTPSAAPALDDASTSEDRLVDFRLVLDYGGFFTSGGGRPQH